MKPSPFLLLCLLLCWSSAWAQLVGSLDLATVTTSGNLIERVLGSVGVGATGVPVAGGYDVDGDGKKDYGMAAMRASPLGRENAGQVFLIFGNGSIGGTIDTVTPLPSNVLAIYGEGVRENTGSEIWMGDVTGDGLGDLIICRQNHSLGGTRIGAGALTLLPGNAMLKTLAASGTVVDLASPPVGLPVVTIYGAQGNEFGTGDKSRLCIWARNGDVTGDEIDDLVIGADREDSSGAGEDSGAVYIIRGGSWLETTQTIDLADFGSQNVGRIARIRPRAGSTNYHLGATVQVADMDGNGKAEVLASAALNRSGAGLPPLLGSGEGSGGSPNGTLYISWDDNFGGDWDPAPDFIVGAGPGTSTIIDGGARNDVFGEELLAGKDYDHDGVTDLFSGDLTSNGWGAIPPRNTAGVGQVIYNAPSLKGLEFDLDSPPDGFVMATFVGPNSGAISGDTAMHGDFNGDGIDDLAFSSPHDDPFGRNNAGTVHIILGKDGAWPALSDLAPSNFPSSGVDIFEIYGAEGSGGGFAGDVLCYSGADGDIDDDGITDLIINEMQGDGSVTNDVGNLLIINSAELFGLGRIFVDGFEN